MRIALLEDDQDIATLMQLWLEQAGHECNPYLNSKSFMSAINRESYDLLILDWMLPDINGDEVLKWVRENIDWPIPVLFITLRDSEEDIVYVLELGADDYMTKPVKRLEMLARINALGRRSQGGVSNKGKQEFGNYHLDYNGRTITYAGKEIELTQKEFDLAMYLFRNAGRVLSRQHILENVWGMSGDINTRTVDTHVSRLRNKLSLNKNNEWKLSAIYHHGYRLEHMTNSDEASAG